MRKIGLFCFTIVMALVSICISSCSKSDDDSSDNRLMTSYQKTKSGIVGTWVMDGYQGTGDLGTPYTSLGWNDPWPYEKTDYYKYIFSSNGTVTDNDNNTYNYTVTINESEKVYYGNDNDDYYWPFSKGSVILNIKDSYDSKFYVEIKNDGLLYFYKVQLGGGGEPKYRYRKQ